ncbi:putative peptidoglycan binding protein [Murinocardiopsis flavida]|uniref:Putative peptidoglycan binding protein n=1 Tax=Murinocardiopsis flavida TaxID=645275 RepID=A0A2P8CZV6_9ACTN|nr:peptidoglycan-binding domain-containing protein [Murinocardiopsis flavida]PSK90494.1 putative peptidoglycan binding protein [Murinocardiopsis flavida]
MTTTPAQNRRRTQRQGPVPVQRTGSTRAAVRPGGLRGTVEFAGAMLASVFAADIVVPEAEPGVIRDQLVELGYLDNAAGHAERIEALRSFQRTHGLRPDGVADARTVTILTRDSREHRELRALGL